MILAYLAYTIYAADHQLLLAGDFYRTLGVPHNVDERALQSRFRRLTVQFHPDKAASGADKAAVEAVYVQLQSARDVLVDPAKRFAYDRFGPDVLQWRTCKTVRDFVFTGVQSMTVYYVASGSGLVLLGVLGYLQGGKYWRYLLMAMLFVIELQVLTRPSFPTILTNAINPFLTATKLRPAFLPFQLLALLRQLAITFFIALSQLGPLLQGSAPTGQDVGKVSTEQLDRLDALVRVTDQEIGRLLHLEMMPFAGDQTSTRELRSTLKEWLVHNTVRNDPEVRDAVNRVLDRRRQTVREANRAPD